MKEGYTPSTIIIVMETQLQKQKNLLDNIKAYYKGKGTAFGAIDSAELGAESTALIKKYFKMLRQDVIEKSGEKGIRYQRATRATKMVDRAVNTILNRKT